MPKISALLRRVFSENPRLFLSVILATVLLALGGYTYAVKGNLGNLSPLVQVALAANTHSNKNHDKFAGSTPSVTPSPTISSSPTVAPSIQPTVAPTSVPSSGTATPTLTSAPVATPTTAPTIVPVTSNVKMGVVINDWNTSTGVTTVESELGKPVSHLSFFKQFGSPYRDLSSSDLAYAKSRNMKLIIAWEPWDPSQGMNQSTDYLKAIPTGSQDAYLINFANSVKSYGGPVVIRFGHEMNGNWYPWGNRPDDYKAAYRYIVNLFRAQGVTNVSWMWAINSDNVPYTDISTASQFYPGDDVVDIIGIDGYNSGTTNSSGWRSFSGVFSNAYNFLTRTYNKPIYIAETASAEQGGDKAAWVKDMFTNALPNLFPKVSEITWFDLNKETDWRIDSSATSLQAFKTYMP